MPEKKFNGPAGRGVTRLMAELESSLATSDSRQRKLWANTIVDGGVDLQQLLPLLLNGDKTSQRFMWLIGDVCELDPAVVKPCLPVLFSLIDEVPFPGMPRSMAKWLLLTNVPANVEKTALTQLIRWMTADAASIGCRSYSARVLFNLVQQERVAAARVRKLLQQQSKDSNPAFAGRVKKLLGRMNK